MAHLITRLLLITASAFVGILIVICVWQYREARFLAIHSYIESVCSAVDKFHSEHGQFPQSLDQIDKEMLDYSCGIPLSDLDYEVTESGYRVSYRAGGGREVSCP